MTNPLYTVSKLPTTSQDAIREFDDRYLAAMGAQAPSGWADMGEMIPSTSPWLTFPVGNLALAYQQTKGDNRTKTLREKSFDVKVEEFDEGIEGELLKIFTQTFAYRAWQSGPSRLLMAEARHRNKSIAALLEDGENQKWGSAATPIDGLNFFSASHLCDFTDSGSTTWSNYQSSTKNVVSITNLEAEVTAMQSGVLDENGNVMDVNPDTIMVPPAKFEPLKNLLAQNMILDSTGTAGVTNPYQGKFNVVKVPEFTDANDWYLLDSKLITATGLTPWGAIRFAAPDTLGMRTFDESSDFFKNTGRIKISSHIWYGFFLGFPHGIRKIKGA